MSDSPMKRLFRDERFNHASGHVSVAEGEHADGDENTGNGAQKGHTMVYFDIPGRGRVPIEHVVLDFNGTIAIDGILIPGVVERIEALHSLVTVHVITADTNGTARAQLENVSCIVEVIGDDRQDRAKLEYAEHLGLERVLAIGNGRNDLLLLESAALGICVIQGEGAALKTLQVAEIVCTTVNDALDLLVQPRRVTATLRN